MDNRKRSGTMATHDVDEIRRQIAALTDASTARHRFVRGTPEYEAALETEERLADRLWRLGTALPPPRERPRPKAPVRRPAGS